MELKCGTCHAVTKESPDPTSYPAEDLTKKIPKGSSLHSACRVCHEAQFIDRTAGLKGPPICTVCHLKSGPAAKQFRPFPNPNKANSDFGDEYSHKSHAGYFRDNAINIAPTIGLPGDFQKKFSFIAVAFSGFQPKPQPKTKFDCTKCHTSDKEGVTESAPSHQACFVCHFDSTKVDSKNDEYALNCIGCHSKLPADGKGTPAVYIFVRQEVIPEAPKNPPFSHQVHAGEMKDSRARPSA